MAKESREFYISELLRMTGLRRDYLESLDVKQLYELYCERVLDKGMI